jgi:hypothetical protein
MVQTQATLIQWLRLKLGDISDILPILSDMEYAALIEEQIDIQNTPIETLDRIDLLRFAAMSILMKLSYQGNEKLGRWEVFGSQVFKQYKEAMTLLLDQLKKPDRTVLMPFFGGISTVRRQLDNENPLVLPFAFNFKEEYPDGYKEGGRVFANEYVETGVRYGDANGVHFIE